jgi:HlyD family secretion protein
MKFLPPIRPSSSNREERKSDVGWRRVAVAGYVLIFVTFGVIGGWAALTKIDRAVAAPGVVAIETNRKTVQHLEGGIVREILAKEGDAVGQGTILFRLENVQAKANYQATEGQLYSFLAIEARLTAERDQKAAISWPEELVAPNSDGAFDGHITADEIAEFDKRRSSLQNQVEVLKSRIEQLRDEIRGIQLQKESGEGQIDFINKELVGLRELYEKKLVPATRLYAMERERERLDGVIGEAIANIAKSNGAIGEYNVQIQQLQEKFQEDVAKSLVEVREKLGEVRQKLAISKDVLHRIEVVAPVAGTVQNLKVFTIGQVIRQGEPLLDIVPGNERLVIEVQFSPGDIDGVYTGQEAEVRFPAFHSRMIPLILGQLESVSRDRLVDETSKQPYYRGIVVLDNTKIPVELRSRVRAGMPAEVIVASGARTVLSYIVSPLSQTLRKGFID